MSVAEMVMFPRSQMLIPFKMLMSIACLLMWTPKMLILFGSFESPYLGDNKATRLGLFSLCLVWVFVN